MEVEVEAGQQQAFEAGKPKEQGCQQADSRRDEHPVDAIALLKLAEYQFVEPVQAKEGEQRNADVFEVLCQLVLPGDHHRPSFTRIAYQTDDCKLKLKLEVGGALAARVESENHMLPRESCL